jgi:hypothetical protein
MRSALSAEDATNRRIDRDVLNAPSASRFHARRETRSNPGDRTHKPEPFRVTAQSRSNKREMHQPARPPRTAHPPPSTSPHRRRVKVPAAPAMPPPFGLRQRGKALTPTLSTTTDILISCRSGRLSDHSGRRFRPRSRVRADASSPEPACRRTRRLSVAITQKIWPQKPGFQNLRSRRTPR